MSVNVHTLTSRRNVGQPRQTDGQTPMKIAQTWSGSYPAVDGGGGGCGGGSDGSNCCCYYYW
jgi:hypothetical protein